MGCKINKASYFSHTKILGVASKKVSGPNSNKIILNPNHHHLFYLIRIHHPNKKNNLTFKPARSSLLKKTSNPIQAKIKISQTKFLNEVEANHAVDDLFE